MTRIFETRQDLMELYTGFYFIGFFVGALSLLVPSLEVVYALLFFVATALLIFGGRMPQIDARRSSKTHFARYSRWNWFSYAFSIYAAFVAFLFVFSPISKPITIFLLWSLTIWVYRQLSDVFARIGPVSLVADYIRTQLPALRAKDVNQAVLELFQNDRLSEKTLAVMFGWSPKQAAHAKHYFAVYIKQNYEPISTGDPGPLPPSPQQQDPGEVQSQNAIVKPELRRRDHRLSHD